MGRMITVNTGDRYNYFTVVAEVYEHEFASGSKARKVSCICDCGNVREVFLCSLRNGHSKSCGCKRGTHRHTRKKPEHKIWIGMRKRCSNPNDPSYARYGGRGITVCERWDKSYQNFYADMGPRPSDSRTLDRVDNNAGYSPGNCRWATKMEQGANKRNNRHLTYNGKTLHLRAWARELGVSATSLSRKIKSVGEQAAFAHYMAKLSTANKMNP